MILASLVSAVLLQLAGVTLVSIEHMTTYDTAICLVFKTHWAVTVLALTALLGMLLAMPSKRRT